MQYLNARPLIEGLDGHDGFALTYDVPARLADLVLGGGVDAALIPVVDLLRTDRRWMILGDACIGCDGETLTVRIFSRVPPERIRRVYVDGDSHTSVALLHLLFAEFYGIDLETFPLAAASSPDECESILLIGDKVVVAEPSGFPYQIDLGGAWKEFTGLGFVFAVWAALEESGLGELAGTLSAARDIGVARASDIARTQGPQHGWPVELAESYLTRTLCFRMTPSLRTGLDHFLALATRRNIVPRGREPVYA